MKTQETKTGDRRCPTCMGFLFYATQGEPLGNKTSCAVHEEMLHLIIFFFKPHLVEIALLFNPQERLIH